MNALARIFGRNTDIAVIALVVGILLVLFAPIPAGLLDFLILLNFSLALSVLLMTFYAPRPVDFSTFPAMLLIATLFRLALNVSATRLILSQANAGHVIAAVGANVVGGNYVIGLIVFLILVVVQYVVVTSGAQRVSEVAARFTLDSMPGQQMSVDADLNMGLIDQDEAKRRRKMLEREAAFYGAMDGASKFVKGDAIAGIVIMLINIIGGLVIGVLQQNMAWGDALRQYTLLTIGDGIVTQVPALVISVGTGLIVTRSSSDSQLGGEMFRQLLAFPRTLAVLATVLVGIALLPGMPVFPPLVIAAFVTLTYGYLRRAKRAKSAKSATDGPAGEKDEKEDAQDHYAVYDVEPLEVEMGPSLAALIGVGQDVLMDRVSAFRKQFASESGFIVPRVRFRENAALQPQDYRLVLFGDVVASARIEVKRVLAIHPTGDLTLVPGVETREPTYGLPALWIEEGTREAARKAKYTLVDPVTVLFTHLCELVRQRTADLLTRADTERMLARVRASQAGLVEELVPTQLTLSDVQKVLQNLLREKVPVRNLRAIVEALIDGVRTSKDPGALTELVRQKLAVSICNSLSADRKTLHVLTLDPPTEEGLVGATTASVTAPPARPIDPRLLDTVLVRIAAAVEKMIASNRVPVILCTPELRRHLRTLCERVSPHLRVISMAEIATGFELRSFASISGAPGASAVNQEARARARAAS